MCRRICRYNTRSASRKIGLDKDCKAGGAPVLGRSNAGLQTGSGKWGCSLSSGLVITHILGRLISVLLFCNNPKPQRGAMVIVSATATSSFVFQRDGGRTSIEMLQISRRRP